MIETVTRNYAKGIGEAVADRTINRMIEADCIPHVVSATLERRDDVPLDDLVASYCKSENLIYSSYFVTQGNENLVEVNIEVVGMNRRENWGEVADRVALGSALLAPAEDFEAEFTPMVHHLRQASLLMSGRHLQHGDENQPDKNIELFTNCSTAAASFLSFYLLLNGSGVGRSYDDDMMAVNWSMMPITICSIRDTHPDILSGEIVAPCARDIKHMYTNRTIHTYKVPDSREGWAHAIEKMEVMAHEEVYREDVLILDFSDVRERGAPIGGMQNRPASGPGPIMTAIKNMAAIRDAGMEPWMQAMYADHYSAECVLVGGARRAARMATKTWRDPSVLEFIRIKRPIEYRGLTGEEVKQCRSENQPMPFLWSSNNSVMVDQHFWRYVKEGCFDGDVDLYKHALDVFKAITECSYYDGTGEPGLINADRLVDKGKSVLYEDGKFAESTRFKLSADSERLAKDLARRSSESPYRMIVNPCGEIVLFKLGGYCVIADVVPYHAESLSDAEDAFRVATRALIRTNTMDALYGPEVKRTNRIGVGMTGLHEFAWKFFEFGWKDLVDEQKSMRFWLALSQFKRAVAEEAVTYSNHLGVNIPETNTTMKPAGTTSKLFGLSEGAHLPTMREYIRWVQFRSDDPLIEDYRKMGYPIRELKVYRGTTIVGFPTQPEICRLGMGDRLVTAAEATPEEQYEYLRLLEKYWITGVQRDDVTPMPESGNQVSYTLKYDPKKLSFEDFEHTLLHGQSTIRCCSVMPQEEGGAYEYLPEEMVPKHEYELILEAINRTEDDVTEDIGMEHVDCAGGACPIDFNQGDKEEAA